VAVVVQETQVVALVVQVVVALGALAQQQV
jgi:hypothetical protein